MGRIFTEWVDEDMGAKYICCCCRCDTASEWCLLWEGFMGVSTPAFLFRAAVNLEPCGAKRQETLSTGRYVLVDMQCRTCATRLGWKYLHAESPDQKYKVGTVLLRQSALQRVSADQAPAQGGPAAAWAAAAS